MIMRQNQQNYSIERKHLQRFEEKNKPCKIIMLYRENQISPIH